MITKEKIDAQLNEIQRELSDLHNGLEKLWDAARASDHSQVMRLVDRLQSYGRTTVGGVRQKIEFLCYDIYEVLEENEKVKDLPKLLDLQMAFDQIQADVKRWDKILYPEG